MGLNFVCGLDQPEDLLQIGSSKWVIASGMGEHGGIFLVDSRGQDGAALFHRHGQARLENVSRLRHARPPASTAMASRLRPGTDGRHLYALFRHPCCRSKASRSLPWMRAGPQPAISWTGCVKLPADFKTNAVTATMRRHHPGGCADAWHRHRLHQRQHHRRGVGVEPEGQEAASAARAPNWPATTASRSRRMKRNSISPSPAPRRWRSIPGRYRQARAHHPTPWFNLDNIHWSGRPPDRGGHDVRRAGLRRHPQSRFRTRMAIMNCHRGWVAAQLDPVAMRWKILAYGEPNPAFGGIATALVIGKTLVAQFLPDGPRRIPDAARLAAAGTRTRRWLLHAVHGTELCLRHDTARGPAPDRQQQIYCVRRFGPQRWRWPDRQPGQDVPAI